MSYGSSAYGSASFGGVARIADIARGELSIDGTAIISFEAVGLSTTEGQTKTIEAGTRAMVVQVNNSGELNVAGEINTTDTAAEVSTETLSIDGDAAFTAVGDGLLIFGGQSKTIRTGERLIAFEVNLSGELNVDGTLNVDDTALGVSSESLTTLGDIVANPQRAEIASDTATILGDTAAVQLTAETTAGELRIDPAADAISFIPLTRGDSFGIDYDDEESVTLNAEQD